MKLRRAVKLNNLIEKLENQLIKFEKYVKVCKNWIKDNKSKLKVMLRQLSKEEHLKYKYDCGFIEKADYLVIKANMEAMKNGKN